MVLISPSILNCDLTALSSELQKISTADFAHVDIMDNHFVPNMSWGQSTVEALAKLNILPLDAHLMIAAPDRWAAGFAEAGAASVTVHYEAAAAPIRIARQLHALGAKAGLALKPSTSLESCLDVISEFDMLLIMTVEPGFGGQSFLDSQLRKIGQARKYFAAEHLDLSIQVDGGVNRSTIGRAAEAGADNFVAGSAVYSAVDAASEVEELRRLATSHIC